MTRVWGRWHLCRGGVINIWEYGRETFDFSGGRVIFQGTNGSGKSRTLELLAPLCLDGDLRQMGSKGYDTVSMRRLMLDDYSGESTRIGYAWLELSRSAPDGQTEFRTCGIGVKASKNSGQISDSWRFLSSRRVEHQIELAPDDMPLGPAQLRDVLGPDCVLDDDEFRARIAEHIYLIPAARYGDLLHLQRTLRNPDIGVKVFDGHLEHILSDALPPLDGAIVEQLATSFEDLHSIQDNLRQLHAADAALRGFLGSYAVYAAGALHDAGQRWSHAAQAHSRGRRDLDSFTVKIAELVTAEADGAGAVIATESRIDELDQLISEVKLLPEFAGLTDLGHQQRLVQAARQGAVSALSDGQRALAAQQRAADSVQAALDRLHEELASAHGRAGSLRDAFERAGLYATLVPQLPALPEPALRTAPVPIRVELDVDPELRQLRVRPDIDIAAAQDAVAVSMQALDAAIDAVRAQAGITRLLHGRAEEADRADHAVLMLGDSAAAATADAADAADAIVDRRAELTAAAQQWHAAAMRWRQDLPDDLAAPPAIAELIADSGAPRAARAATNCWAAGVRHRMHGELHAMTERAAGLHRQVHDIRAELDRLRSGQEPEPYRPGHACAEREPGSGAPFYRLVDFVPGLSEQDAAGLEAALAASGVLTAWVTADGAVTDRDRQDILAAPGDGLTEPDGGLATLLVPALEPDCPVSEQAVARLLSRIGVDLLDKDQGDVGLTVAVDGRWQSGALHGAWRKGAAEFIGAGARAAALGRWITECEGRECQLREALDEATTQRDGLAADIAGWEHRIGEFPDYERLVAAHARTVDAASRADKIVAKAAALRQEHDAARERVAAERAALIRDAADAGLAGDGVVLAAARDAAAVAARDAGELRNALTRGCSSALADLRARCADHDAAQRELHTVGTEVERRCAQYRTVAAALAELTDSVGQGAAELGERLRGFEAELRSLRRSLPELRARAGAQTKARITAEAQCVAKAEAVAAAEQAELAAAREFAEARQAPGAWAAAVCDGTEMPDDPGAALRLLPRNSADGVRSEDAVLASLQELREQLPATYAVAPEHHGAVLTVAVSGEDGRQPVADAAAAVAARLRECNEQLGQHYQDVLSDYLINDLSVSLSAQIGVAEDLYRRMNEVLDNARSSQGVHVQLRWSPAASLDEHMIQAIRVIRTPLAKRSSDDEQALRRIVIERIEAERDNALDSYVGILSRALDYRSWFDFSVIVRDSDGDGKPRTRRFRNLSSGETRLISYVTLFAAAAAFYDALSSAAGSDARPLRLTLLDEAFERIDDPTIARMLGLLVDLDMDWIITWPSGWGISSKIPRMHIYDVLRPEKGHGIACAHTIWDGSGLAES